MFLSSGAACDCPYILKMCAALSAEVQPVLASIGCNDGANRAQRARSLPRCSPSSHLSDAKLDIKNKTAKSFSVFFLLRQKNIGTKIFKNQPKIEHRDIVIVFDRRT